MAKLIVTIESNKEYDMSHKGMLFGIYSYHPPGPWVSRIVDFITDINTQLEEKGYSNRKISCNITNMTGPTAVLKLKGKKCQMNKKPRTTICCFQETDLKRTTKKKKV